MSLERAPNKGTRSVWTVTAPFMKFVVITA